MATLGRFASATARQPVTPTATDFETRAPASGLMARFRQQPVVLSMRRRPGWLSYISYDAVNGGRLTVPPPVHSTDFQPTRQHHRQWQMVGNEPWWGRVPRFSGEWFKSNVPTIAQPWGQQAPAPRWNFVYNVPMYRLNPPTVNGTSSKT